MRHVNMHLEVFRTRRMLSLVLTVGQSSALAQLYHASRPPMLARQRVDDARMWGRRRNQRRVKAEALLEAGLALAGL
jgi:hypothetical protein